MRRDFSKVYFNRVLPGAGADDLPSQLTFVAVVQPKKKRKAPVKLQSAIPFAICSLVYATNLLLSAALHVCCSPV